MSKVSPCYIVIQIKICAEYQDMLPRPRLVCQEPGLRPIGRSPGVPDKSSRGLGSMSQYSAQILTCFIAYIFLFFFHSSVGLVGNFAGLPVCRVPSAIVHCNQNEAGRQTTKAPSMPCWGAAGPSKHSLAFKSQPGENDRQKRMKSVSIGSLQHKNQVNGETLAYLWVILLYSSLESRLNPAVLEGQVRLKLFWNWLGLRIWQLSHSCQTGVWEYFPCS